MTKRREPPKRTNDAGEPRRIGVEIEFGGLDLQAAASLVQRVFGGSIKEENPHKLVVADTEIGDFGIELDTQLAQPKS